MESQPGSGGFSDLWKGQYCGREVAVKVSRVSLGTNHRDTRKVGCPQPVVCINELTMSCIEVLRGGCDMEGPPSSERAATNRRDDDRDLVRDGIGADGKWEHQLVCESER